MIEHTYNLPFYKGRPYKCVLVTLSDSGWCFEIMEWVILRFKLKLRNTYKFKDLIVTFEKLMQKRDDSEKPIERIE